MIDMHTHILPGVDDGADNVEQAMEMIRECSVQGITRILLTPHGNWDFYKNYDHDHLQKIKKTLEKQVEKEGIQVELCLGMEVFGSYDLEDHMMAGHLIPINNSRYMMIEFPFDANGKYMMDILSILDDFNYIPVIAHAERYFFVQKNPSIAYEWNKKGYVIQINKDSILGKMGRREEYTAARLLDNNLVQIISSDCHGNDHRTPGLRTVYRYVSERFSKGYADLLMDVNPDRILNNQDVLIINPRYIG